MSDFEIGSKVVYPGHGVGIIKGVEDKELAGTVWSFYVLTILDNGMTIEIPTVKAVDKGLRFPMQVEKIEEVYDVLRDRSTPIDKQTWNRRYREYSGRIQTGDPLEVAAVLRDLYLLRTEKQLSYGERSMYDKALSLIVQEIAVAKNETEENITQEIDGLFH